MKLIRAHFDNFRIIREMELNFSTDATKPLTVVRAANESGKTTLLMALQWALYGDAALPNNGKDYRLHPLDWKTDTEGTRCNISASVEFEVKKYHKVPGTGVQRETTTRYRIVRTATEQVSGDTWNRSSPSVSLFELLDTGDRKKEHPDSVINEELPPELREVFFTDGDRALSFIEANATQSVKRERVQRAIRSLLGLEVVQETLKHVKKTAADINKRAKAIGGNAELTHATTRLAEIDDQLNTAEKELESATTQFIAFDDSLREVDKKIEETLKKGDREQLAKDLESSKRALSRLDERIKGAVREHSNLFKSEALARDILAPLLSDTFKKLDVLRDQNKIPSTTIPVLEEQLKKDECVCGETLSEDDSEGKRRRTHICKLIDESRQADAVQGIITQLYFGSKGLDPRNVQESDRWMADYLKVATNRDNLDQEREEAGRKYKGIEANIAAIPDTDIQTLKAAQGQYKDQRDRFNAKRATLETQINGLKDEAQDLTKTRERLLREQAKGGQILAELVVVKDIQDVLQRSYERITDFELKKVSNLMNTLFLEMIGADIEQGALITRAEISSEFDILVYGPGNRTLNPDRDLNGASRRALTLAFILALTKISEVEAPNVIDTPLGMTSGYVKRSILRTVVKNSTQLIMFLTHDEIAGTGEIIEQYSGMNMTVTNPAHYPRMLVSDPRNKDIRAMKCGCKHDQFCPICERRLDPETETAMAKVS